MQLLATRDYSVQITKGLLFFNLNFGWYIINDNYCVNRMYIAMAKSLLTRLHLFYFVINIEYLMGLMD